MANLSKSLNLMNVPENTGDFIGKPLDKIFNLLGKYSKMERIEDHYYDAYTWVSPTNIIKLAFDDSKICIRVLEDSKIKPIGWLKAFMQTPIFLTLFAGLVSVGVGYSWELIKFKQQTVFEKRINLILDSRKQVQDIYIEYDRLVRQVRSYELEYKRLNMCDNQNLSSQIEEIKLLGLRVRYIQEFSKGVINSPELKTNISSFEVENLKYINCLATKTSCEICTDQFKEPLKYLNKIIELHTTEINLQIQ